jgi:hypothetical protein
VHTAPTAQLQVMTGRQGQSMISESPDTLNRDVADCWCCGAPSRSKHRVRRRPLDHACIGSTLGTEWGYQCVRRRSQRNLLAKTRCIKHDTMQTNAAGCFASYRSSCPCTPTLATLVTRPCAEPACSTLRLRRIICHCPVDPHFLSASGTHPRVL